MSFCQSIDGAFRKLYSSRHSPIHLLEKWKMQVDQNKIIGAVLHELLTVYHMIFYSQA